MKENLSRRSFLGASAGFAAAGLSAVANPIAAAAQSVGVKPGDLPDLTIKEVKVYVTDMSNIHKLNGTETGELISVVTNSGIEGNYTIGDRSTTPGWLEWAKPVLVGKNIMDLLPTFTSTSGMKGSARLRRRRGSQRVSRAAAGGAARQAQARLAGRECGRDLAGAARGGAFGTEFRDLARHRRIRVHIPRLRGRNYKARLLSTRGGGTWPNYYTAAADVCMWDILGKAVNQPIYKILSGGTPTKTRLMAYASSQHLPTDRRLCTGCLEGEGTGVPRRTRSIPATASMRPARRSPTYIGHMEEIQARFAQGGGRRVCADARSRAALQSLRSHDRGPPAG
jgi:hypothetical protein